LAGSHHVGSGADPDQAATVDDWEVFDLLFDHFLERIANTVVGVIVTTSWMRRLGSESRCSSRRLGAGGYV